MIKGTRFWTTLTAAFLLAAMFTGCSRDPGVRKQKYFESGQRYYEKGKYREAAIQFENALQVDGRFAEAHYQLALTQMKLQQWPEAFQHLTRTVEIQPDNYAAHLDMVNLLLATRPPQLKEAKEHLDTLRDKQPNNADVHVAFANYYAAMNDLPSALTSMQTALQRDPNRSDLYLNQALLQVRAQQWDDAEKSYRKAADLDPKSSNALISLGNFYQLRGRFPEAEQLFRRAIDVAPSDPEPRGSMARLYMAENKPDQAEAFLKQAKKDFPDNSVGYRMLGDFYFANSQLEQATAEYTTLYRDHPKDPTVKKNYVQLLILSNRTDEARTLNDQVLKATPDDVDALVYKGQIEIRSGKPGDAINTLQGVLKNEPTSGVAHYQLGLAFEQAGNFSQAESEWREALRQRPDLTEARRSLAHAAIRRGDANGLAQEADQIIALEPESSDGYLLRAIAEINRKQYVVAETYINRALAKFPNNPPALIQLGNLRAAQNRQADAQKAYQQALDVDPTSNEALGGVLNIYLAQGQHDKALAAAQAQSAKSPQNAGLHVILGRLYLEDRKDARAAETAYRRALEIEKGNADASLGLGMALNAQGKADEALQTYLDAAKANPGVVAFQLLAGGIYESRQDWSRAKQLYQNVIDIQPDNAIASNNLAYVMLQQGGNVDVALAMAQTARRQLPNNASSADTLGWAYYHKGVYDSAIGLFKEAVKRDPDNATYNFHLGLAYAKNGQAALARQQLERVARIKPGSQESEELKRALEQMKG